MLREAGKEEAVIAVSFETASRESAGGCFYPLYFVFGPERYLREKFVENLSKSYLGDDTAYGREKYDGGTSALEEILASAEASGLFSSRKLIIVDSPPYLAPPRPRQEARDPGQNPDEAGRVDGPAALLEAYLSGLDNTTPDSILVFLSPGADRRRKIFKLIEKKGQAVECGELKGQALAPWIRSFAEASGKKIDRAALERLLTAGDLNLYYLSAEIEKYALYLGDSETIISAETVDALFSGDMQGNVFKLADALTEGDLHRAFAILELLLGKREQPLSIFFMLVRHYRLLMQAHSLLEEGMSPAGYAGALSVQPFAAARLRAQAEYYDRETLESIILMLQETDLKIKTGRLEAGAALGMVLNRVYFLQFAGQAGEKAT